MKRSPLYAGAVGLTLLTAAATTADVVTTSDGSRIVGTVEQIADGKLIILTQIAGRLEIDASMITGISTDRAVHVEFSSGDTLVGTIETSADGDGAVVRSQLGEIPISPSNITLLWPEGDENPKVVHRRAQVQAEIAALKPRWAVTLEAGATRSEGNTDTREAHGRFDVKRTSQADLLHFYLVGSFGEQDKKRTTNEYYGGARYENAVTQRRYWYARTELEFDEFEGIDLRATAAAGGGYYWVKQTGQELKTSTGGGYRHESYDDGRVENDAVLDLGLDYRLDIAPWVQLAHSTMYSPDIEDLGNYRLKFDTALLIPFKDERWAWKLGMRNEYNSQPQPGFDRLDNTYYTSIVLSLK